MHARRWSALALGFAAVAAPPVRAADPAPLTHRAKGDLAIHARAILRKYCGDCHGETAGPFRLSVLDHTQLVAKGRPVPLVNLDVPPRSQIIELIEDGSMPPGGRPRPTPDEVAALKAWVAARAPGYPRAFDARTTLVAMLDDLDRQPRVAVPHLRYLYLSHLVRDDQPPANLKLAEDRLQRALLAASGRDATAVPVDAAATVFRIDLRALGWDTPDLFDRFERGHPRPDAYPMIPFDLLLLEYPHPLTFTEKGPLADRLGAFYGAAKQVRPIPFLRADWVAAALAPRTPLAADMKSLVDLARAPKTAGPPCGPPVQPFADLGPTRSPGIPPPTAWYTGHEVPGSAPFALKADLIHSGGAVATGVTVGEPFKLRVTADREVRVVLLNVLFTGEVRVLSAVGGTVLKRNEPRLFSGVAGKPFAVASLPTGADTVTDYFVVVAAEGEVPLPTVVRSRHADAGGCQHAQAPVWRFLFDHPAGGFDPTRAIRAVVPVTVTRKKP